MELNRREKKKLFAREKIMDTAISLFAKKGFNETSIAEIMKQADLGTGTFYNYFKSKDELLNQYLKGKIAGVREIMVKVMSEPIPASQKLMETIKVIGNTFEENQYLTYFFNSLFRANSRLNAPGKHGAMFRDALMTIIKEGQAEKEFNPDISPEIILELIHSILLPTIATLPANTSLTDKLICKLSVLFDGIKLKGANQKCS